MVLVHWQQANSAMSQSHKNLEQRTNGRNNDDQLSLYLGVHFSPAVGEIVNLFVEHLSANIQMHMQESAKILTSQNLQKD